jgi:Flp pilus assembly protein TadG
MHKRSAAERGNSLVEVALVLPVLMVLFLGIVEVAFLLFAHVQVANAAREGRAPVRCAVSTTSATLTDAVKTSVFAGP